MESKINTIEFKNLYLDVINTTSNKGYLRLIESLSGKIESGKLTAVFGNKGVGKTTFLDLLIGLVEKDSKTHGEILYNGKERDPEEWKKLISYVSENKECFCYSSLYEQMSFYMSLGNKKTKSAIDLEINDILDEFSILDKKFLQMNLLSQEDLIKGVIAISIVKNPKVLILDDIIEGLDTKSALDVITTLKKFAKEKNKMVIISLRNSNDAIFNFIDDLIVLVKCGMFYSGPYKQFDSFLESNEIKNENNLSTPEFLSIILSDRKNKPEAKKYEEVVENIIEKNAKYNNGNNITKVCNNYKKFTWKCKLSDVKKIMKRQIEAFKQNMSTKWFSFYCFAMIFICFIGLGNHFLKSQKISSITIENDIKTCSYKEGFYFSCAFTTYLFKTSFNYWIYIAFMGMWSYDSMFKKEYLTGQYSFGTYFLTIFCYCFAKNFIWIFVHFIFWVLFYRNFMLQPLILFYVICFTLIFLILQTIFSLLFEYSSLVFTYYFVITGCIIEPFCSEIDLRSYKKIFLYLHVLNPAYMFVVYLKTKCFDLIDFFKDKPEISHLLKNQDFDLKYCEMSYKDGIKEQLVTEFCDKWTDYVLIANIIFSCIFSIVLVLYFYKKFSIPNTRYKLN